jgi:predicted enzyme related to lactoylglutathione lyase
MTQSKFFWYELMTSDQDAAIAFYEQVVGWKAAEQQGSSLDFRYMILNAGDRGMGGVMQISDEMRAHGARPAWLGYILVDDADAAAKSIAGAGGAVHMQPADIPNIGRFAMVADPGGAAFYVMAPLPRADEPPPADPTTLGLVSWHELYAGNGEKAAFEFYSGQFGWETMTEMDMGPMGTYRIFGADGVQMGGMMDKPEQMPVSAWNFYVNVESVDAAVERVKAGGGQIVMGPMEVPGGSWVVQGIDPQGAHFALVSLKR